MTTGPAHTYREAKHSQRDFPIAVSVAWCGAETTGVHFEDAQDLALYLHRTGRPRVSSHICLDCIDAIAAALNLARSTDTDPGQHPPNATTTPRHHHPTTTTHPDRRHSADHDD